jgi:hypothetical protein
MTPFAGEGQRYIQNRYTRLFWQSFKFEFILQSVQMKKMYNFTLTVKFTNEDYFYNGIIIS